jgi:hypothetical protein
MAEAVSGPQYVPTPGGDFLALDRLRPKEIRQPAELMVWSPVALLTRETG